MQSKASTVVMLILLATAFLISPMPANAGIISGKDVYSFSQSLNSTITDMNYDPENKIFSFVISGPNGTTGWFWIMFNVSSKPTGMRLDGGDLMPFQLIENLTYQYNDPFNASLSWSYPAVAINFTLHFSTHEVWITWASGLGADMATIILLVAIAIVAVVMVAVFLIRSKRRGVTKK